jgi:AAA15 family ATPase/GTPase
MRIKEISLKNFKRFTDLTIKDIPESAKLVLLIGANGSGKSSVFDAFASCSNSNFYDDESYYQKSSSKSDDMEVQLIFDKGFLRLEEIIVSSNSREHTNHIWIGGGIFDYNDIDFDHDMKPFFGRSSMRIVPRIPLPDLQKSIVDNEDAPTNFIDHDVRFNTDIYEYIREINTAVRSPFMRGEKPDISEVFREYLSMINESFAYILGEQKTSIKLVDMVDSIPGVPAEIIFQKGDSRINYDLLSHGEKQVVTLLLDFVIRRKYYQDTIYFIDEMDTHLETSIQKRLIEDVVEKWIPEGSQLWTASHALGFIEYANKSENAVILDFDNLDFDVPQVILPSRKEDMEVYEIAIPKEQITNILKGYNKLVIVENKNDKYYNAALSKDGFLFLPAYDNREVFLTVKNDSTKLGLRDKDYLIPSEVLQIQQKFPNLKVLKYYNFENYIYHPDNIFELGLSGFNKDQYISEIQKQKNQKLLSIASRIETARTHYPELKEEGIKKEKEVKEILDALQSDEFEIFYPYFDMKDDLNKEYLSQLGYTIAQLAQTNWFKSKIKELLT